MCCHISCKIRFKAPKRQRGSEIEIERESKDAACKAMLTIILLNIEQKSLLQKL